MVRKSHFAMPPVSSETTPQLTPRALTKQEFGRRVYNLMVGKGWTQSGLAREVTRLSGTSIGRDSISTYINGKTFPTPQKLEALAKVLGVTKDELLPNAMMNALDDEHPAIELKQAAGHPGKAWLRVNRALSYSTAAKIIQLIDEDDRDDMPRDMNQRAKRVVEKATDAPD